MDWTSFPGTDGTTAPNYGLATDGSVLFANFFDRIVKVALPSGAAMDVYRSPREIPLGFESFEDDTGMIVEESDTWLRFPYDGGPAETLTLSLPAGARVFDFDRTTDTFLARLDNFDADTTDVLKVTVGDAAPTVVLTGAMVGKSRNWFESGGTLFTQGLRPFDGTADDNIYSFAAGMATPTMLTVSPPANQLIGVTSTSLYYVQSDDIDQWGVYRVPHAGGTAAQVHEGFFLGLSGYQTGDTIYINDASNLWRIKEGEMVTKIAPVPAGGECTTHEVLAHDGFVYAVTYHSTRGDNQIWRIAE